jgi:hypothetical protein
MSMPRIFLPFRSNRPPQKRLIPEGKAAGTENWAMSYAGFASRSVR